MRGFQGLLVGDAVVGRRGEPRWFFSKGMAGRGVLANGGGGRGVSAPERNLEKQEEGFVTWVEP